MTYFDTSQVSERDIVPILYVNIKRTYCEFLKTFNTDENHQNSDWGRSSTEGATGREIRLSEELR